MKKVLSLVLVLAMVLGSFSFAFADDAVQPTDNDKVNKLIELGLVTGDAGGYRLEDTITRAEAAVMVVRALDLEAVAKASNYNSTFADANDSWAKGYINVAAGRGIVNGYPDGTFKPNSSITYAEIIKMMVQVLGGLNEEEAKAPWPSNYITKAAELGVLKDAAIANYGEVAVREGVFEVVYNAIISKNSGLLIANTVEGIIVENYRTETLKADEVVIHVMKDQVQQSEESKYYEEGDEFKITLTPELKKKGLDVETLLGKVVAVSFDKTDKVVAIEVNDDYEYVQGLLEEVDTKEILLNDEYYTVGKDEARTAFDERLYQVYYNNDDISYDKLIAFDDKNDNGKKETGEDYDMFTGNEFARATVRNGKVLFIEAFNFDDIAPVAKDINDDDEVAYYDDAKDGEVDELTVDEDAYVIEFSEDTMKLGNYADIAANDVIHWYTDEHDVVTVFVRPADDNMVEGEYEEANAAKAKSAEDINIVVDDEEYPAIIDEEDNLSPVYSTISSEHSFYTLTEDYDLELAPFEEEEVTLLRDMFGYVQLIGSEIQSGNFYAVISNEKHQEVRLVYAADKNEWFGTDRDTKFVGVGSGTKDAQLNRFDVNDLVLVSADEDLITRMEFMGEDAYAEPIKKLNKDVIDFDEATSDNHDQNVEDDLDLPEFEDYYYIAKNALVFVTAGDTPKAMDVKTFLDDYYDPADKAWDDDEHVLEGYVVVDEDRDEDMAEVIVITKAVAVEDDTDSFVAKVTRVRMRGDDYLLSLQQADGTTSTHTVTEEVYADLVADKTIIKNDIIEVEVTDDDDQDIVKIAELIDADTEDIFRVVKLGRDKARGERYVVLRDANDEEATVWLAKDADVFGEYSVGSLVALDLDETFAYKTINLIYKVGTYKKAGDVTGILPAVLDPQ